MKRGHYNLKPKPFIMDTALVTAVQKGVREYIESNFPDLQVGKNNAGYDDTGFNLNLRLNLTTEEGIAAKKEQLDRQLGWDDLQLESFKDYTTIRGEVIQIVNYKPRSRKYPWVYKDMKSGKQYKIASHSLKVLVVQPADA